MRTIMQATRQMKTTAIRNGSVFWSFPECWNAENITMMKKNWLLVRYLRLACFYSKTFACLLKEGEQFAYFLGNFLEEIIKVGKNKPKSAIINRQIKTNWYCERRQEVYRVTLWRVWQLHRYYVYNGKHHHRLRDKLNCINWANF